MHKEDAGKKAPYDLYVVRIKRDGSYGDAKPCAHCADLIKRLRIRRVYYSLESPAGGLAWKVIRASELTDAYVSSGIRCERRHIRVGS